MTPRLRRCAVAATALALVGSCISPGGGDKKELSVLAASSLAEVFPTLAERFESSHPDIDVRLSFGASSTLAQQVVNGAPADILATADANTMAQVVAADLTVDEPVTFATNSPILVTPADNPAGVADIGDLEDPALALALCEEEVPCGVVSRRLLALNGVEATPVTLEPDVKAVLTKVTLGEVDAGVVYVTDALAAGDDVQAIPVPGARRVSTDYQVSVVTAASDVEVAGDWLDLLRSEQGRRILATAGFELP